MVRSLAVYFGGQAQADLADSIVLRWAGNRKERVLIPQDGLNNAHNAGCHSVIGCSLEPHDVITCGPRLARNCLHRLLIVGQIFMLTKLSQSDSSDVRE